MENFVKKKCILISDSIINAKSRMTLSSHIYNFHDYYSRYLNKSDFLIGNFCFMTLNKNHISEIFEASTMFLNIEKERIYEYIHFYSGRKQILIEKKNDFSKKIECFYKIKYQEIIMSNGNKYITIFD